MYTRVLIGQRRMKGEHLVGRVVMVGDPSTTMFVIAIDWVSGVLVRFVGSNPGLVDGTDANRGVVHLSLLNRSSNAVAVVGEAWQLDLKLSLIHI